VTAQIHDKVHYRFVEYSLLGADGGRLPTPFDFGILPTMMHTGCVRGYLLAFAIESERLFLREMTVRSMDKTYPPIAGRQPEISPYSDAVYKDLDLPLDFSGGMLLGTDFIRERYVHMGFQSPSSFRKVVGLRFERGKVIEMRDRSREFTK
jgi:hypothetical protein